MSGRKDHNTKINVLVKSPTPRGSRNKFILKRRENIQWDRINEELPIIHEYFTCFGWISSLCSLLFFNFKYPYTISYNTFKNLQNSSAIMCQKLKTFRTLFGHLRDDIKFLPILKWKTIKISIFLFRERNFCKRVYIK